MSTDVLFAHSFFLRRDAKQWRKMRPYPPLATLYAAAVVRAGGRRVALFDAMLAAGPERFAEALDAHRPAVVALVEDNFNFVTKMCLTTMREAAFAMIAQAKGRGAFVVVNGSDATDDPEAYLTAGADAIIVGETEQTLPELLGALDRRADWNLIEGLVYRNGERMLRSPARGIVADLDTLPLPAWDLIDVESYRRAWQAAHGRFSLNLVTTRGCPFHCNWCAKPVYGTRYSQRSPAKVVEELAWLRDRFRPDHIWFADDIFGLKPAWTEAFGAAVVAAGVRTPFMLQSRADLMTEGAVRALAAAGAEEVWMGVESGSQRILDAMEKGLTLADVETSTARLRAHGIRACWFLQLGYEGETWDELLATIELVRRLRPDDVGVSVSYPLPGTKFYERVRSQLGKKTNWSDSDELAMIFEGTYRPELYRAVRDAIHREVDFHRTLASADGRAALQLENESAALADLWREIGRMEPSARIPPSHAAVP